MWSNKQPQLDPIQNAPHERQGFQKQLNFDQRPGQNYQNQMNNNNNFNDQNNNKQKHIKEQQKGKEQIEIKRNITDGRIQQIDDLAYAIELKGQNERIQDINEDNLEYLVQTHLRKEEKRTLFYLENLKSGKFVSINENTMKEKEEGDDQEEQVEILDQFSQDLYQIIKGINVAIIKMLYFFQGIFMGYCLMHSVMLYQQTDDTEGIEYYSTQGQRLSQAMQLLSLVCFVGSIHLKYQSEQNVIRSVRAQTKTVAEDKSMLAKSKFTMGVYSVTYILVIIGHPWVSQMSDNADKIAQGQNDYADQYSIYKIFTIIITIFSTFGWMLSVSNIKSPVDYSLLHQDDLDDFDDNSDNDLEI